MCGACGRAQAADEWSGQLDSRRARWEVAQLADRLLAGARSPARVSATPSGWLVRSATGRTSVVDTLTDLWAAVGPLPDPAPSGDGATSADRPVAGTVAAAVRTAYERHVTGSPRRARGTGGTR